MAWEHLSVTKPHLVYIILGGFTSLFMLCSSIIKERLYIGEATVATICGIIFGPHAANLINPLDWGNTDLITLEFSRIVLVVQCFAVGVELPKAYMERHWRSVTFLLVPVMTFGWLVTSLFIWWLMNDRLNWLDSLCVAACVTATDPVLASSVVGKGKFAKRVPKHLRDLLSAESGCNDGMAFPFIYLALYLIRYRPDANAVSLHWFCYTILYECVFGAVYGVIVGYLARRAIRYAHEHDFIDRESFLVFYFVLALFCAGSGSMLGMDDLLIGFACGVGFSNDGWFLEKTEEAHVSNVIDLLINLAFFVYFGTIIPWEQFNSDIIGTTPWKLVVIALLVLLFRRIPVMLLFKPVIPDIKTWREALFAGHFGPIGVGAIFVAILARAELETEESTPLAVLPEPGFEHLNIIELIWPITTFLVLCSIVVHGSSIAVFTLGKHINTLTLTLSYTTANEEGPSWIDRLPRIQSRSKSSISLRRPDETDSSWDEKIERPPGMLPPIGIPGNLLRRQREDDDGKSSRASSLRPSRRRKKREAGMGHGGPISRSAITPQSLSNRDRADLPDSHPVPDSEATAVDSDQPPETTEEKPRHVPEVYREGDRTVVEDDEGNVLDVLDSRGKTDKEVAREAGDRGRELMQERAAEGGVARIEDDDQQAGEGEMFGDTKETAENAPGRWKDMRKRMESFAKPRDESEQAKKSQKPKAAVERRGARAYQYGNTIIVEDEDGEVIKKYDIPAPKRPQMERRGTIGEGQGGLTRQTLHKMGGYLGMGHHEVDVAAAAAAAAAVGESSKAGAAAEKRKRKQEEEEADDARIRFRLEAGGRRMSKAEFIQQMQRLDPKARAQLAEDSNAPEALKKEAGKEAKEHDERRGRTRAPSNPADKHQPPDAGIQRIRSREDPQPESSELAIADSDDEDVPFHPISSDLAHLHLQRGMETAAQHRRRLSSSSPPPPQQRGPDATAASDSESESDDNNSRRAPIPFRAGGRPIHSRLDEGETEAERKRREGALGISNDQGDSSSESEDERPLRSAGSNRPGSGNGGRIRFAAPQHPATSNLDGGETEAERKRREGALGLRTDDGDSSSSEDEGPRGRARPKSPQDEEVQAETPRESAPPSRGTVAAGENRMSIRFAEQPRAKDETPPVVVQEENGESSSSGKRWIGKRIQRFRK